MTRLHAQNANTTIRAEFSELPSVFCRLDIYTSSYLFSNDRINPMFPKGLSVPERHQPIFAALAFLHLSK